MPENKGYASMDKADRVRGTIHRNIITDMAGHDPDGAAGWKGHISDVADPWKFMEKDLHPKAGPGEFEEGKP